MTIKNKIINLIEEEIGYTQYLDDPIMKKEITSELNKVLTVMNTLEDDVVNKPKTNSSQLNSYNDGFLDGVKYIIDKLNQKL
jgi:hypothetical protein